MARLVQKIRQARTDVVAFAELCFTDSHGQPIRLANVHRELQTFLSHHDRALVELPRDHGKSLQVCMRIVWELGRDPSLRVRIVCANEAIAAERGRFLRDALADNRLVKLVFPRLQPSRPWEAIHFTLERTATIIGPTVAACGIGSGLTGTRADLLVCDDIVDVKAIHSRAERERVERLFRENLVNLLEPDGRLWCLFTPWHPLDLNSTLKRSDAYAVFRRPIDERLTPVWPEVWTRERLEARQREIGPIAFARAYRLMCNSELEATIPVSAIQYWSESTAYETVLLAVDPAVSTNPKADASALVVLGRTNGTVHCLEATARRVSAVDLVQLIDDCERRWRPDVILFETNAAFQAVADLMKRHAGFGHKIQELKNSSAKAGRILAFSVTVRNGRFLLKGRNGAVDAGQSELLDEMLAHPLGEHDDLVDAAAFGSAWLLDHREPRVFNL